MASPANRQLTPQEYLTLERKSEHRSEYIDGETFAMTGASRPHNLICGNIHAALHHQLSNRPCEIYASDMRVKVEARGLYMYPDVVIVCGSPRFEDAYIDTLLNPTVIIEVLSESTEKYDRGRKFEHFRQLDSFQEYVLVAQDEPRIEQYTRQPDGRWLFAETRDPATTVDLVSIGCSLPLAAAYVKVPFLPRL